MENLYGIENLKKIISSIAKTGNTCGKAFEDGKLNGGDVVLVPELFFDLSPLFNVEYAQVMPEAKDINTDEANALVAHFNTEFDLPQDNVEWTIESVLSLLGEIVSVAFKLYNIFKKKPV